MTAILTVQNVDKSFGARQVLASVSFAVHQHDRIGLLGLNGAGKSTLLRLLAGATDTDGDIADGPDAGLITKQRGLRAEYVPQEPKLRDDDTVQDVLRRGLRVHAALLEELQTLEAELATSTGSKQQAALLRQAELHEQLGAAGGWDLDHELRGIAASLELPPMTARIGHLSGGEKRRVALAMALLSRPDLLLLDEPTNHLDARTIEWLELRLRAQPGALVLVTHDRYFLDRVATRILEIDRGRIYSYEGNYQQFLEKQAERLANEAEKEHARASFVRRELDWIRRGPQARSTKQKARIDRFNEAVDRRPEQSERPQHDRRMGLRLPTGGRLGKTILEIKNLSKSLGGKLLFSDLTLLMKPGDRIGIVGRNGAGKTTLVRTLLGDLPPDAGEVVRGFNTRIAFLDQGRSELNDANSVLEEVAGDNDHVILEDGAIHVRSFLRLMLFDDRFADAKVSTLSGGERNRVQLAKLLRRGGNLLVLDEPTNDLDLLTLSVLEDALVEFPGCALVVSHDRWFLDKIATGILAFEGNGQVTFHEGNYSDYHARLELAAEAASREAAATAAASKAREAAAKAKTAPAAKPEQPAARRMSFKEQKELEAMESTIGEAEQKVSELQAVLNDPAVYKDRASEVTTLIKQLEDARAHVEALYSRWQALEELTKR